jgi:putative DNA primase/helicase
MIEDSILAALREENKARCEPPLFDEEVRAVASSVARYDPEAPISGDGDRSIEEPHYTDTGNAERFVRDHAGDVLFCHPWNRWLVWDGVRWTKDERGGLATRVKRTLCAMHENAGRLIFSDAERQRLAKHALATESERARGAMLELAKCEVPVVPEELDADPMLLNTQNGIVRLSDGTLHPHDRGKKLTKCTGAPFDPNAECPQWLAFLDRIFEKNAELIGYMQRALGYSLTGDCTEEAFFVCYGTGANGKSTLFGVVQKILGDYATTTRAETVLAKRHTDSIPNDVAALMGARFVTAIEAEEGRRLASGLVKSLTGRDKLSARFMRGEFFEFEPIFKLWIGVNHKPRISDSSPAMWRRVKLIPFTVTIPLADQDPDLRDKLLAERAGILAWLVDGCTEWKAHRLGSCDAVDKATRAYRDESNTVAEWVGVACTVARGAEATHAELFGAFNAWCEREGEEPLKARAFGDRLEEAFPGVKRGAKVDRQRGYRGISLNASGGAT